MGAWNRIGLSIRYPKSTDGALPEVMAPLGVLLLVPGSAIWLASTLAFALLTEPETFVAIGLAVSGGVAPIGIAYGVATNRNWTRLATVLALAAYIVLLGTDWSYPVHWGFAGSDGLIICTSVWVLVAGYLYLSRRSRKYYLLIAEKPLPRELEAVSLRPPDWLELGLRKVVGVADWAFVALALFIIFGYLFGLFDGW